MHLVGTAWPMIAGARVHAQRLVAERATAKHPGGTRRGAMTMGTVFVIEADDSVRSAVTCVVESLGAQAETFESAEAFLARQVTFEGPGCIVADVRLPDADGLALQDLLNAAGSPYPIVFLGAHVATATAVRAMKAGAVDVLEQPVQDSALGQVVRAALRRAKELVEERLSRAALAKRHATLTPREKQVFALVTTGMLNKQVAWAFGISEKTIKVHRARVMEKMGASSLAELVRMADRIGASACACAV